MDVKALKAQIQSGNISNYLFFSGDEWKIMEIYIAQISKVTGKEVKRIDSIVDIYKNLRNKSFIERPFIYVVRDDKELMQSEKLWDQLESNLLAENILIHLITNVDKRTRFYNRFREHIIVFERLSESMLKKYILKEIKLSEVNIKRLIECCENDYGRILLEIDKIKSYMCVTGEDSDFSFERLIEEGVIYKAPYDAIFDLVDSIMNRKVNRSFDLLQQSYAVGEATMVMLSVLYGEAKATLQVQSYDGSNIGKATGLSGWQIQKAKSHCGKYSIGELNYILNLIHKLESGIKRGKIEEEFVMQYLLVHIL